MDERKAPRPLAVITGASTGIGYHLALIAAGHGYDLVLAADTPLDEVERDCTALGAVVRLVKVDLATTQGVSLLVGLIGDTPIDALMANAGHGLGGAFLDQDFAAQLHVINTNITGTVHLIHALGRKMRERGHGQILITGSVAGFQPGAFHAVYNATKAFVDSFSQALRNELKGTGVSVTCLIPGPTDTEFFARADLQETRMGEMPKMDPRRVARMGFDAMLKGDADVVTGLANKLEVFGSKVLRAEAVAEAHRHLAESNDSHKQE